jgi:hypothetical protein
MKNTIENNLEYFRIAASNITNDSLVLELDNIAFGLSEIESYPSMEEELLDKAIICMKEIIDRVNSKKLDGIFITFLYNKKLDNYIEKINKNLKVMEQIKLDIFNNV